MSNNKLAVLGAALTVFLLVSCASAPQRELSREDSPYAVLPNGHDPLNPDQLAQMAHTDDRGLHEGLILHYERKRGHALNILELSGGGQNGAFGAGFLKGWRESGNRPEFDAVTGVSTGALLATHAFLGTPADDVVLEKLFTQITQKDIYRERGTLAVALGGSDSVMNTAPLKALIDKYMTAEVLQRVAAAYDDNRTLWVGTTNLDRNQTWVWNMTLMAKRGGADALDLYRKVLLASSAFPVAFPPVEINRHLFADGSIRSNVLVTGLSEGERPKKPLYGPGNIYLIHNGKLKAPPLATSKSLKALAGSSIGDMMDSSMQSTLLRAFFAARAHGYRFNYVGVPQHIDIGRNPLAFDPGQMRAGFDAGRALAKQANPWSDEPPRDKGEIPEWLLEDLMIKVVPD